MWILFKKKEEEKKFNSSSAIFVKGEINYKY